MSEYDPLEQDWKTLPIRPGVKKHTLDSDEEDEGEEKKYEILDDDDIEGQEDGTAGYDGEVQITPFNMREELEEGHFDTEGNYHWKKEKVIRDNWLENIDWVKIKQREGEEPQADDSDSDESTPFDAIPTYRKMLSMMKPGESVSKALQRLGGNKNMSASERWRRKKAGHVDEGEGNRQHVIDLTEHANKLLTETGNMDIYQETYEHISSLICDAEKKHAAAHPAPKNYADALDMYADDFDDKEKARLSEPKKHKLDEAENGSCSGATPAKRIKTDDVQESTSSGKKDEDSAKTSSADGELQWEFKWKEDSTDINGPHLTEQMQKWVDEGYFKEPVWVRKVGQNGPFYSSRRVDFDLYL